MKLTAVIIDDEALARDELSHLLSAVPEVELKASCQNALEGIRAIHELAPELAFVDIQMPGLDGFQMLQLVDPDKLPAVIFVTALDDQAVRAFEEDAADYIVKPVRQDRLQKAVERALRRRARGEPAPLPSPSKLRIPCLIRDRIRLFKPSELLAASTDPSGTHVRTAAGRFFTELTLRTLEERGGLFRCHKQFAVSLDGVQELRMLEGGRAELLLSDEGEPIPVGRRYLKRLKDALGLLR